MKKPIKHIRYEWMKLDEISVVVSLVINRELVALADSSGRLTLSRVKHL